MRKQMRLPLAQNIHVALLFYSILLAMAKIYCKMRQKEITRSYFEDLNIAEIGKYFNVCKSHSNPSSLLFLKVDL